MRTAFSVMLDPLGPTRIICKLVTAVSCPLRFVVAKIMAVSPGKYMVPALTDTVKVLGSGRTRKLA